MSKQADQAFQTIRSQMVSTLAKLNDADYLEVLEQVKDECEARIDAKEQENQSGR
jgi:hypothetical protein